jgi:hypothetical protein
MDCWYNEESTTQAGIAGKNPMQRRDFFKLGISVAGAVGTRVGFSSIAAAAQHSERTSGPLDATSEAKKIAFDRIGNGERVLLLSGFPQTRRSWNRLIPLLSPRFQLIPADLPSFGDSGILSAPATTENVARVFHEFVGNLGAPLKVAHPLMLRAIAAAKRKNDTIDARKIADCLRCDLLPECHMASTEIRDRRRTLRYRNLVLRQAVQMKNRVSGLLMETGGCTGWVTSPS